jgi:hypothetical protein
VVAAEEEEEEDDGDDGDDDDGDVDEGEDEELCGWAVDLVIDANSVGVALWSWAIASRFAGSAPFSEGAICNIGQFTTLEGISSIFEDRKKQQSCMHQALGR